MSERGKIPQVGAIYRGSVPDTDPMYRRGWSVVSGSSRETIDQGSDTPGLDDRPRKAWPNGEKAKNWGPPVTPGGCWRWEFRRGASSGPLR